MRIISDFHDYYDSVQALGQDQGIVYIRKRKDLFQVFPFPKCKAHTSSFFWLENLIVKETIIGFCGKIYPVIELAASHSPHQRKGEVLCHTLADVDAFVEANFKKKEIEGYKQTKGSIRIWRRYSRRMYFEEWFEECRRKQDIFRNWFIDLRCPIFTVERPGGSRGESKMVLNARLTDRKFYKLVDTYSAFQEISSFVAGLAVPLKDIPKISDIDMRDAKGFDGWSFRKEPTKRR